MREFLEFNYFEIPKVETKVPIGKQIQTNVSSNAYYGYQPSIHFSNNNNNDVNGTAEDQNEAVLMDTSFGHVENDPPRLPSRKRAAENSDPTVSKKRRENDMEGTIGNGSKTLHLRRPTHNIPDLSMCTMGYCIY